MAELVPFVALATDGARNKFSQYVTLLLALAEAAHDASNEQHTKAQIAALIDALESPPAIFNERSNAVDVLVALQTPPRIRRSRS